MFEILLERIVREEVQRLLATTGTAAPAPATPAPTASTSATGLFLSPKESKLLEHLSAGPRRQGEIIASLEDQMNATSIKETLSNLVHRRLITKGPEGYSPA